MENEKYFIGIDGGGTYTKAIALTKDGTVACHVSGDTINFNSVSFEEARENLMQILDRVTDTVPYEDIDSIFIGCSALDREAPPELTRKILGRYGDIHATMDSDLYIALCGYSADSAGILVISGTGSMGIAKDASGRLYTCGGWGYGIGDEGSAYDIAVKGINAAVRYHDGLGKKTCLCEALLEHYHLQDPKELIPAVYQPELNRKKIASFAVEVTACAEAGDDAAVGILEKAATDLADIADSLIQQSHIRTGVGIYGGVFENSAMVRERFITILRERYPGLPVSFPRLLPEIGAAVAAMKEMNIRLTDAAIKRLSVYSNCGGKNGQLLSEIKKNTRVG